MGKQISLKTKRNVITDVIKDDYKGSEICKRNKICLNTLYKVLNENKSLYDEILGKLRDRISARALLTAEKTIKRIKKDKIETSTGLQLSQMAKNLTDLSSKESQGNINIMINMPKSKEELLDEVFNLEDENTLIIQADVNKPIT